jgi:hypothetical protein
MAEGRFSADDTCIMHANDHAAEPTGANRQVAPATCPECNAGDVITISMSVADTDLAFSTCHLCEAKWWHRDGEPVELRSILGLVATRR